MYVASDTSKPPNPNIQSENFSIAALSSSFETNHQKNPSANSEYSFGVHNIMRTPTL